MERPAVQSKLSRLWKSYHPVPAGFSHIFLLLLPAPKLKPQLCKLHDPGAITPKIQVRAPCQRLSCKRLMTYRNDPWQAGTDEVMHISLWESFSEAEQLTDLCQLSITCEVGCVCAHSGESLTCHLCRGRDVELWPERPARGDGSCHSSCADHCWESVTIPWACLSPASAHAQSNFCATWNDEEMENVWEKPRGLNRAQAFMSNS